MKTPYITIPREVAERFMHSMETLTGCMESSLALHNELKLAAARTEQIPELGEPVCWLYEFDGRFEFSRHRLDHSFMSRYASHEHDYVKGEALIRQPKSSLLPMPLSRNCKCQADISRGIWLMCDDCKKANNVSINAGHCVEGDNNCCCGGDTPGVRAGCGNWRKA